ncbi:hypothetical protein B0H15DRAFT_287180 [Mycena belliarum]|uniref:Uncharacterized protein n=1 Tax=Mycena belliarum TaxID=1033014 RepID=A0AAD6XR23_9AGAR|nr:hypothetical protein B0H15DRAFT_287180 [Mycena belliae]
MDSSFRECLKVSYSLYDRYISLTLLCTCRLHPPRSRSAAMLRPMRSMPDAEAWLVHSYYIQHVHRHVDSIPSPAWPSDPNPMLCNLRRGTLARRVFPDARRLDSHAPARSRPSSVTTTRSSKLSCLHASVSVPPVSYPHPPRMSLAASVSVTDTARLHLRWRDDGPSSPAAYPVWTPSRPTLCPCIVPSMLSDVSLPGPRASTRQSDVQQTCLDPWSTAAGFRHRHPTRLSSESSRCPVSR